MAESGSVIGKVASILGQAFAKGADGTMRPLKVGDAVFEGEVVQAPPGGHVELAFGDGTAYFARDNESVTLDSRVFGDSVGQGGNVVGKVASIEGQVFAKGPDGTVRQLKVGDPVYEGDLIQSSANGRVELAFDNGAVYFLRDKESVTLDGMVFGGRLADAREAALLPGIDTFAPAVTVTITEDANNDGIINTAELSGPANVSIGLPGGAAVGDIVTVSDGTTTNTITLVAADLLAGTVTTSFAAPASGSTLTVTATLTDANGNVSATSSDSALIDTFAPAVTVRSPSAKCRRALYRAAT
jgi:hypothetical protein